MKSKTQDPNHTTLDGEAELDRYVIGHSDDEPDYLYKLWRATNVHMLHGRMASGHLQGRLLKMLVQMIRPRNIIEVGTFSGYSALCMAEALGDGCWVMGDGGMKSGDGCWVIGDGGMKSSVEANCQHPTPNTQHPIHHHPTPNTHHPKVYTFEINDEQEDFTRPWIENSPWAEHVEFIIGDAITEAPRLARDKGVVFDMAFLDGDKRTYIDTYEAILPLMPSGAYILADNTLWDGHVIDPDYQRDPQTKGIRAFNEHVTNDERVTRVILPLRDGLTIIRKK